MIQLKLFSEPFRPEGGAAGQGIIQALGRPELDHISVLIREAIQNAWDARSKKDEGDVVVFRAILDHFTNKKMEVLNNHIFERAPDHHPLQTHLKTNALYLILEDRGTVGLTGPVFVEHPPGPEDRFLNLCRIFGRTWENTAGGGTYGYGKAVYFTSSSVSTIIIHSRCEYHGQLEERLIAISLWKPDSDTLDTGRYWWGLPSMKYSGVTGPVIGNDASEIAKSIGFTPFKRDETGTSIMVLAPQLEDGMEADPYNTAKCISETMAIWFWPRMLGGTDGNGRLECSVRCMGDEIPLPDLRKDAPFNIYSRALENLIAKARRGEEIKKPQLVEEICSTRPAARLGWLSLIRAPFHDRKDFAIGHIEDHVFAKQIVDDGSGHPSCHHVALIRAPGQVIRYLECRENTSSGMEYGGVFLVEGKHDHSNRPENDIEIAFAKSEPPSHDNWSPDNLDDDWHRRYVRIGLKQIRQYAGEYAESGRPSIKDFGADSLGAISAELGELLTAVGPGASPRAGKAQGGDAGGSRFGGDHHLQLQVKGEETWEEINGKAILVVPFNIIGEIGERSVIIQAFPKVVIAGGGSEVEAPIGEASPRIHGWRRSGEKVVMETDLKLSSGHGGEWQLLVEPRGEVMVAVNLSISSSEG